MRRLMWMFVFGSPLAYGGSYLLTVEKFAERHVAVPHYRFGGKIVEQLYTPAHWVDAHVRAAYWQGQ